MASTTKPKTRKSTASKPKMMPKMSITVYVASDFGDGLRVSKEMVSVSNLDELRRKYYNKADDVGCWFFYKGKFVGHMYIPDSSDDYMEHLPYKTRVWANPYDGMQNIYLVGYKTGKLGKVITNTKNRGSWYRNYYRDMISEIRRRS